MKLTNLKMNSDYVLYDKNKEKCNVHFLYHDDEFYYFDYINKPSCKNYISSTLSADIIIENTDTKIKFTKLKRQN
jgi:hypothetical protein